MKEELLALYQSLDEADREMVDKMILDFAAENETK